MSNALPTAPTGPDETPENPDPILTLENPDIQQKPADELSSTPQAASKIGLLEKIRRTGARIIQNRGITWQKGKGRPRKDGMPSPTDTILEAPTDFERPQAPLALPGASPVDHAAVSLCRKSIVAAVKALDWLLKEIVRIKAEAAELDPVFTEKALKKAEPDPRAMDDFQNSLDAVLRKHNFKPQHDEEWALLIDGGRLFAPYVLLLTTFNAEIERKRNERREAHADEIKRAAAAREANRNQ